FHDLLRAYAVDQVNRQESAEERRAVQRRVLTWYLHALDAAQARIEPNELRIPLDPVEDADMTLATFADYDAALTWYEAESANLVTATRAAREEGLPRIAWQLAAVLRAVYLNRNPVTEWLATS